MTDHEDSRMTRVEEKVDALTDDLRHHIIEENGTFKEMHVAIERLAVTSETHTKVLDRVADAIDEIASHNARLSIVETKTDVCNTYLEKVDARAEEALDGVKLLEKERSMVARGFGVLTLLIAGAWAVFTFYFSK